MALFSAVFGGSFLSKTLPRKVTINAYLRSFHYKILNNIFYQNRKVDAFGL